MNRNNENNGIQKTTDAVNILKTAILQSQSRAVKAVNQEQLALYYGVGRYISANTRNKHWGGGMIKSISQSLRSELPGLRGFSETNLKNMRAFYEAWNGIEANSSVTADELKQISPAGELEEAQISKEEQDTIRQLQLTNLESFPIVPFLSISFTHHITILTYAKDWDERLFYIQFAADNKVSAEELEGIIKKDLFHHQGAMPNNFLATIPDYKQAYRAIKMFKDEYLLDYINVEDIDSQEKDVDERLLEQRIIHNIKRFIMTLGRDFAFVGNQYHLEIYGEEMWSDLLFFNRELNALVAIELKIGKFKPIYLGQLQAYLQILDDKVRKPHENPSIGIVLCKSANQAYAEYAVRDYNKPMGVATYKTIYDMPKEMQRALPDIEELKRLMSDEEDNVWHE
jgi:predicted nuclease of restriction endonuclease-like (RecB) superfamily